MGLSALCFSKSTMKLGYPSGFSQGEEESGLLECSSLSK